MHAMKAIEVLTNQNIIATMIPTLYDIAFALVMKH
jgi:hypothetical protein